MSLLRRRLVLAGVLFDEADHSQTNGFVPTGRAVTAPELAALPGVAEVKSLDWSACSWASVCSTRLDELLIVRTEDPAVDGLRHVIAGSGVVVLHPGLLMVHCRWPTGGRPDAAAAEMAKVLARTTAVDRDL